MNIKIKKYFLITLWVIVVIMISFLIYFLVQIKFGVYTPPVAPSAPVPIDHYLLYPGDPQNDRILIGASQNVFVAKIISQTGNKVTEIGPRTQYEAEVVDNIKGNLVGKITIDLLGGFDFSGNLVLVEDEGSASGNNLLKIGATYLFATRYNDQEKWYTVIAHPNARELLSENQKLNEGELQKISHNNEKFNRWEIAYPKEILDEVDVKNERTKNSFESLPTEAKAVVDARASEAEASLKAESVVQ